MNQIPNADLREKDIPSNRASWKKILPFAMSFDAYKHWETFDKCREVARLGIAAYRARQPFTQSMTELRTCLFYEARRWRHLEKDPNRSGMEYIHALLDAILARVRAHETG